MNREELIAPEMYNVTSEIERYADGSDRKALIYVDAEGNKKDYTYDRLMEDAGRAASVFEAHGLQKGDVVLVMVPRLIEAYTAYIGALKAGIAVIPSSEMLRASDIEYRLAHSGAKAIIAYEAFTEQLADVSGIENIKRFIIGKAPAGAISLTEEMASAPVEHETARTKAEDMAFLSYTSGTTGKPKGVVHTHGWGYAHLRTTGENWLGIKEGDTVWATAAPGWQKWIWTPFLAVLGSGATGLVYNGKFAVETYLTMISTYGVNVLCCTPTEYRFMAKADNLQDYDLSSLRSAVSAGEPLNKEVIDRFEDVFSLQVRDGYGQTENTLLVGTMLGMEARPGSMGKPTPGNRVEIVNDEGEIAAAGEVGDIAVHVSTPALFKEYLQDPERTAMQFRGDYYITGDRAKKDEDGYFWFEGRGDDIIISSGYTIGPFEVEDALTKHPAVRECAVVASPDEVRGTVVKAFVVLRNPEAADKEGLIADLQNHVKETTAPYKYPRKIEFVDELPKTASGKIMRVQLRKMEMD
ncbi:acyl--CoA ligase [Sporosarcina sp. NCCP-2716]|uniref:acyl-CoA synthetase MbcS n=1 Tax=Sporosarcina sp. NCCP-2716 TaxID=2943679 RepID=UPI00203AF6FE|nr:acyl--CoA ligase [Sporosarcina sp. NCCP-2716]GKV69562.1 acyl--CoA ligase [Sporosarcina sp. NCCP-2716]